MQQLCRFLPLLAAVLSVLFGHATANSISAFYSRDLLAPQVMMFENSKIYYSLCNSAGTPIFPYDDTAILPLKQKPIENTDIAISAGKDGAAFVHYQDEGGGIVQAKFTCDNESGHWTIQDGDSVIVSGGKPVVFPGLIMTGTPLSVLSSTTGSHQIFYKTWRNHPSILEFRPGPIGDEALGTWLEGGYLTQDVHTGSAIDAVMMGNEARVVMPRNDNKSLEIAAHKLGSNAWDIYFTGYTITDGHGEYITNNTHPDIYDQSPEREGSSAIKLEGFSNASDIGIATVRQKSSDTTLASIFYIGNDKRLHNVIGISDLWGEGTDQPPVIWPPADTPDARLGVTSNLDTEDLWIYYMSGGSLTQVYMTDGDWQGFVVLKKPALKTSGSSTDSTLINNLSPKTFTDLNNSSSDTEQSSLGDTAGLSQSRKVYVGVGAGVGAAVLLGLAASYMLFVAKKSRKRREQEHATATDGSARSAIGEKGISTLGTSQSLVVGSPAPGYVATNQGEPSGQWVNGQWVSFNANLAKQWGEWHLQQYQQCQQQQQQIAHHRSLHELQEKVFDPEPQELATGQSVRDTFEESPVLGKGKTPERNVDSPSLSGRVTSLSEVVTPWPTPSVGGSWLDKWHKKPT